MSLSQILLKPVAKAIPLSIPDCVLWLNGQNKVEDSGGNFPDDTEAIQNWKSFGTPTEHVVTQAIGGNRPSWLANGLDSRGGVDFTTATPDYMNLADTSDLDFTNGTGFTIFLAATVDLVSSNTYLMVKVQVPGGTVNGAGLFGFDFLFTSADTRPNFRIRPTTEDAITQVKLGAGDALSAGEDVILAVRLDWNANLSLWKNGGTPVTADASSLVGGLENDGAFVYCCRGAGLDSFDGKMLETIIYKRTLSDAQTNLVGNYIANKYTSLSWTDI
jgi:hypothetical protein